MMLRKHGSKDADEADAPSICIVLMFNGRCNDGTASTFRYPGVTARYSHNNQFKTSLDPNILESFDHVDIHDHDLVFAAMQYWLLMYCSNSYIKGSDAVLDILPVRMFAYGYGYAHAFAYDYAIVPAPVFAVSYVNVIQSIHWQPAALTLHAHWGGARYWSGWYGFRDEWATSLQWMRREEYEAWREWQRSIRSRNLSTVESAQLLYRILQAQDETVPSERERIVERMMQSTMEISRDEYGHVEGIVEEVDDDHHTSSSNRRLAIEAPPDEDRYSPRTSMTQRRAAMNAQEEDSYSMTRTSSSRSKSKLSKADEEYYEPEEPRSSRKRDKKGRKEKTMDAIYEDEVYDGGDHGYGDNGYGENVYEETKVSKRSSKKSSHKPEASSSRSMMQVSNDTGTGSSSHKSKKSSSTVTTTTTTTTTTSTSEQYDEGTSHKSSSKKGKSKLMIEGTSSKKGKEPLMIKSSRDRPASPMAAGFGGRWADSGPPDDLADDFDDMTLYPDDSVSNVEGKKKKKDKKKLFSRA
ncbi:hypothetical protein MRB53_040808 [Persea americana]|nr:hypothetical protein MRB53_040808 [Persea americana]